MLQSQSILHRIFGAMLIMGLVYNTLEFSNRTLGRNDNERSISTPLVPARVLVIGSSEANALFTTDNSAIHLWESGASLNDRLIQLTLGQRAFPDAGLIVSSLNPLELVLDPNCMMRQRSLLAFASENARRLSMPDILGAGAFGFADLFTISRLLLRKAEYSLSVDPTRLMNKFLSSAESSQNYRDNGSIIRVDHQSRPKHFENNAQFRGRTAICRSNSAAIEIDAAAKAAILNIQKRVEVDRKQLTFVITPLHPVYRSNLALFISRNESNSAQVLKGIIASASRLGLHIIDNSARLDGDDLMFLDGDHLSSAGERAYQLMLDAEFSKKRG